MRLASLFPLMSPALTDVRGTKRLPLCFPTFISKNPVRQLLTPHLQACCLRQFHGTLKPSPVDVTVPWDTQCFHLATRVSQPPHEAEGGLASPCTMLWVVRESSPSPASPWERAPLSSDFPCLSSSCPQNDKKMKVYERFYVWRFSCPNGGSPDYLFLSHVSWLSSPWRRAWTYPRETRFLR